MLLFLALLFYLQNSFPIQTLIVDFRREAIEGSVPSFSEGTLYYDRIGTLVVEVVKPVRQTMVFSKNILTIYYPVERVAFKIEGKTEFSLPFVSALMGATRSNYGLDAMGYTLEKTEFRGDTLVSYWVPPQRGKKHVGRFVLVEHNRALLYAESKRPDGSVGTTASFSDHKRSGNLLLALRVESNHYTKFGVERELIQFSNPRLNNTLPDSVVNFRIPDAIPIKYFRWD